ncbi:hypothetical protein SAMN02927923_02550 [Microvirga guangxiensis]|uniref:Uncharacterized protein n=1 Tax=Microvirga guangxiensis TaxID=549386 RepID=A0A1G5J7H4_9HYPH|nr:hypothetical protein SAMN02927923_02550 [Microvirga guangxiensis]
MNRFSSGLLCALSMAALPERGTFSDSRHFPQIRRHRRPQPGQASGEAARKASGVFTGISRGLAQDWGCWMGFGPIQRLMPRPKLPQIRQNRGPAVRWPRQESKPNLSLEWFFLRQLKHLSRKGNSAKPTATNRRLSQDLSSGLSVA